MTFLNAKASIVARQCYQSSHSHTWQLTSENDFTEDRLLHHLLNSPFSLKIQFGSLLIQFLFNLLEILYTAVHI